MKRLQSLELKIPPVLLVIISVGVMALTAMALPTAALPNALKILFLCGGTIVGAGLSLAGVQAFRRAQTTVNPLSPEQSSSLVTSGVYQRTRNPMYVGFAIFLMGFAGFLGSLAALLWVPVFVAYMTQFQIKPEERALQQQFPDAFKTYQQQVRRWL